MFHHRFRLYVLMVGLVFGLDCCTAASPVEQARIGIQSALAKRAHARQVRNLNAYMSTFTTAWKTVNVLGRVVTYATLHKSIAANFAASTHQGLIQSHITHVALAGHSAQVTVTTRFNYPVVQTVGGPVYRYKDTVASEVWVKGQAGWQEQYEHYLADNVGVSVKPVPMANRKRPHL